MQHELNPFLFLSLSKLLYIKTIINKIRTEHLREYPTSIFLFPGEWIQWANPIFLFEYELTF
jgi:hypothetical protein